MATADCFPRVIRKQTEMNIHIDFEWFHSMVFFIYFTYNRSLTLNIHTEVYMGSKRRKPHNYVSSKKKKGARGSFNCPNAGRLHSPSDKGYQRYALPSRKDPFYAPSWVGDRCHCISCEFEFCKQRIIESKAIIFLDMDNLSPCYDILQPMDYQKSGIFLWGFCNDDERIRKKSFPCVPCGPEDQAVDLVILICIKKLQFRYPQKKALVVTMDADLQKSAQNHNAEILSMSDHTLASWSSLHRKLLEIGKFLNEDDTLE